MDGKELLNRVKALYRQFQTYSDEGTADLPQDHGPPLEFKTRYKRPRKFRFEWLAWHPYFGKSEPAREHTVCSDGNAFYSLHLKEKESLPSFSIMLAGATGISSGSINNVINILEPGSLDINYSWSELSGKSRLLNDSIEDIECFHIIGTAKTTDDTEIWIESRSLLLKRLKHTIVITEEDCIEQQRMFQSKEHIDMLTTALKKANLSQEDIQERLTALTALSKPRSYCYVYHYKNVIVDEMIDDNLFIFT